MSVSPRTQKRIDLYNPRKRQHRRLRTASGLAIESLALPDEPPERLRALYDELIAEYQPVSGAQLGLVGDLTVAAIEKGRCLEARTAVLAQKVRTAEHRYDMAVETEVEKYRVLLPTAPAAGLAGLKRSAAGTRYLVRRWERLGALLQADGTLHGQDLDEATILQGARAGRAHVAESETSFATWLYCLVAQGDPTNQELRELNVLENKPKAFQDRDSDLWIPCPRHCRMLLADLVAQELAVLRPREEWLRTNIEEPERAAARAQARVLTGPERALLASERHFDQAYHRAYQALNRGRPVPDSRARATFAPAHSEPLSAAPRPVLIPTPFPAATRADAQVLDYHAVRRAVLDQVEPD